MATSVGNQEAAYVVRPVSQVGGEFRIQSRSRSDGSVVARSETSKSAKQCHSLTWPRMFELARAPSFRCSCVQIRMAQYVVILFVMTTYVYGLILTHRSSAGSSLGRRRVTDLTFECDRYGSHCNRLCSCFCSVPLRTRSRLSSCPSRTATPSKSCRTGAHTGFACMGSTAPRNAKPTDPGPNWRRRSSRSARPSRSTPMTKISTAGRWPT